ncbi:hypothetical protein GWO43_22400 [candidate division KSB1 bacterium]|nr:hypothetical protein [candidate division KSB1 bacterium]NIT73576.1 hypothetical protein [candidate division KSB1 bacterium]NIX73256.1 hypothetical protein [candidate division KSB1 bacterium]
MRKDGRHVASEELKSGGRLLTNQNGRIVDGPYTETKEAIGGFFLIEANNLEEALEISQECPHFNYGGSVEIREVNPH